MMHRVIACLEDFEAVEKGVYRWLVVDDDPEYNAGDELYLQHFEGEKLKWLIRRRIVTVKRNTPSVPTDCCALELM